jgi:hypothetical protein|tara:strand:- start:161 stop:865 length:705 start_codon:yes stop_codon:yes gene_type:complete|mmetsp:Transcript_7187/g.24056  ORF Transcript_7187/g.24056 Transcript_7187/m.24056 type:complete len:235 (-) Transcript_7187:197-901(-)
MRYGVASTCVVALLAFLAPSHALAGSTGETGASENLRLVASKTDEPLSRFCRGNDCPPFTVESRGETYDVRLYPGGLKWTSTVVSGVSFDDAVSTGFGRLFRYISGENAASEKIPMTAPVRVQVAPGDGPFCDSNFTVSFFVPFVDKDSKKQMEVPAPTDPSVFNSVDENPLRVFVKSFGGYSDEKVLRKQAAELAKALVEDGVELDAKSYYSAGYDSPFRPIDRHNEVWMTEG